MMDVKVINLGTAYNQVRRDIVEGYYEFTVDSEGIKWNMGQSWYYRNFIIPRSDDPRYAELANLVTFMYNVADIAQSRYRKEAK